MTGRLLVVDSIATNRIILKVKLASMSYDIVQAASGAEALDFARATPPDLIVADMGLPDMTGAALCARLRADPATSAIPVLVLTDRGCTEDRIAVLTSGADDVLFKPVNEAVLLARLRSILRERDSTEGLRLRRETSHALGFAEPREVFAPPMRIALIGESRESAEAWRSTLPADFGHTVTVLTADEALAGFRNGKAPDVLVICARLGQADRGLTLLAELRSRPETRNSGILMVLPEGSENLAPIALDLGASDLIPGDFSPDELALRLATQIRRKNKADLLRDRIADGLEAAVTDPLTGLPNRRYALSHLSGTAEAAASRGRDFAVMVLDLDNFKAVNDKHGHAAGDAVLIEVARRLRNNLRGGDLVARIGGEEFLVVLPDMRLGAARRAAQRLCQAIRERPFIIPGKTRPALPVTISIGLAMGLGRSGAEADVESLIARADNALYAAKDEGRNTVTVNRDAA